MRTHFIVGLVVGLLLPNVSSSIVFSEYDVDNEQHVILEKLPRDSMLSLRCFDDQRLSEKVKWYMDGVPLNNLTSNVIEVKKEVKKEVVIFWCQKSIFYCYTGDKVALPSIKGLGEVIKVLVKENDAFNVSCTLHNDNQLDDKESVDTQWYFNGEPVSKYDFLRLEKVSLEDTGVYWCPLKTVYLHVIKLEQSVEQPSLLLSPKSPLIVSESGQDANIPCIATFDNVHVELQTPQHDEFLQLSSTSASSSGFLLRNLSLALHHGLWLRCVGRWQHFNESIDFHVVINLRPEDALAKENSSMTSMEEVRSEPWLDLSSFNRRIKEVTRGDDVKWVLVVHNVNIDVVADNLVWMDPRESVFEVRGDERHKFSLINMAEKGEERQVVQVVLRLLNVHSGDVGVHHLRLTNRELHLQVNMSLEVDDIPFIQVMNEVIDFEDNHLITVLNDHNELIIEVITSQSDHVRLMGSIMLCNEDERCSNETIEESMTEIVDYTGLCEISLEKEKVIHGLVDLSFCDHFDLCSNLRSKLIVVEEKHYDSYLMKIEINMDDNSVRCSALRHFYHNLTFSTSNKNIEYSNTPWSILATLPIDDIVDTEDSRCIGVTRKGIRHTVQINTTNLMNTNLDVTTNTLSMTLLTMLSSVLLVFTVVLVAMLLFTRHKLRSKELLTKQQMREIKETCLNKSNTNTNTTYVTHNTNTDAEDGNEYFPMMPTTTTPTPPPPPTTPPPPPTTTTTTAWTTTWTTTTSTTCSSSYVNVWSLPFSPSWELRYKDLSLEHELGSGSTGLVFKARYKEKREVAVKTLLKPDLSQLKDLITEAKVLSYIGNHVNVVGFVGICTERLRHKQLYLVLEYCTQGNLLKLLTREKERREVQPQVRANNSNSYITLQQAKRSTMSSSLSSLKLLNWSLDVARGMSHLADLRVLHADLATRNILVDGKDVAKIADFGLSRLLKVSSSPSRLMVYEKRSRETALPVRWMAPESLTNLVFSTESDVFAFGITLWEIFALGKIPQGHIDNEGDDLIIKLLSAPMMKRPALMAEDVYKEIVVKCWNKRPTQRPTFQHMAQWLSEKIHSLSGQDDHQDDHDDEL